MGNVDRLTRVNELMKRELAGLVERDIRNAAPGMLVSITEVKTSVDLREALVFVSIFGGDAASKQQTMREIIRKRCDFQRKIASTLAFKHTPVLQFKLDSRLEAGDRVLELLNNKEDHDATQADSVL